jgi:hypothetical protein
MPNRNEAIELGNQTLVWPDIEVDYVTVRDEHGLRHAVSVKASEEEKAASYAAALRRELGGVEHQLAHLDDEPPPWVVEVPNRETVERTRTSLEGTKAKILDELKQLEPEPTKAKKTA